MVYAIRALTVERGLDPREFVMFSYGGGGGLFAAFVAQELDIATVVVPRAPANFSAVGILMSDYREDAALTKVRPLDRDTVELIKADLADLASQTQSDLGTFGFDGPAIDLLYRLDMRYAGQDDTITVPLDTGMARRRTDPARGRRPALRRHAPPALRLRRRRHAARGRHQPLPRHRPRFAAALGRLAGGRRRRRPKSSRPVYFGAGGGHVETPVYDRDDPGARPEDRRAGDRRGVDDHHRRAARLGRGGRSARQPRAQVARSVMEQAATVDVFTAEIVRNGLTACAFEMGKTLARTAHSTLLYDVQDFGVGVVGARRRGLGRDARHHHLHRLPPGGRSRARCASTGRTASRTATC